MKEESFSPEQSLQLIQSMINKTKQGMSDNSVHFLVWGWITLVACVAQYFLKHIYKYEKHYLVWMLAFIGIVFSIYQGRKEKKTTRVKTYIDDSMGHLWLGMAISYLVLSLILTLIGWGYVVFPFFMMLYGLGSFVSGNFIRFKPLIIGGVCAWLLAIGSTLADYDHQMLFGAAAILVSYIIPAYLLRRKNKLT